MFDNVLLATLEATDRDADELLAACEAERVAGPTVLAALELFPLRPMTSQQAVRALVQIDRVVAHATAVAQELVARVAGARTRDDWGREEVAAALRLSPGEAGQRVSTARDLTGGRLPRLQVLLLRGEVSYAHVLVVSRLTVAADDATAAAVDAAVAPRASEQTVAQLRQAARRALLAAEPRDAQERHAHAVAERRLDVLQGEDGTAELVTGPMSAAAAEEVRTACDLLARRWRAAGLGDGRTLPQLRNDALVELARRFLHDESAGTAHGRAVLANVHVTADTLAGRSEEPGWLDGYGPIPPQMARDLARDARRWRAVVTDGDGVVLEVSTPYVPTQLMRDRVVTRYERCTWVGCCAPAWRCDLDHNRRHPDGPTCDCNLAPLCRRHHRMRHETPWHVVHRLDHVIVWISPTNRIYLSRPRSLSPPKDQDSSDGTPQPVGRCPHPDHAPADPVDGPVVDEHCPEHPPF